MTLSNVNDLHAGTAEEDSILIDRMHLNFTGIQAYMMINGKREEDFVKENSGLLIDVDRVLFDPTKTIPALETKIQVKKIAIELSKSELDVFMGILLDNFGEAAPPQAQDKSKQLHLVDDEVLLR